MSEVFAIRNLIPATTYDICVVAVLVKNLAKAKSVCTNATTKEAGKQKEAGNDV